MDLDDLKQRLQVEVETRADTLREASHRIHEHPETNFEEHFAHGLLADLVEADGLRVERGAFGLDTAFVARAGDAGPTIAVLCEYDALPGIGHACGHNIIATAGLGAGLALAALAREAGGRIVLLGTPAEEGGGGKIVMARAGAFDGVDAAMMVHPAGDDLTRMDVIAVQELTATYTGEAAHAAAQVKGLEAEVANMGGTETRRLDGVPGDGPTVSRSDLASRHRAEVEPRLAALAPQAKIARYPLERITHRRLPIVAAEGVVGKLVAELVPHCAGSANSTAENVAPAAVQRDGRSLPG